MNAVQRQINGMINNATRVAKARAQRLAKSGGCDPQAGHFCKAVVYAALTDTAKDYFPLHPDGKADAKNLLHF